VFQKKLQQKQKNKSFEKRLTKRLKNLSYIILIMTINFVEIKNEYTILLCDIISPYIYQGFQSIYESAVAYKNKNNVDIDELRIFQDLLRNVVPNWNNVVLDREVARIKICSKRGELLESLLKTIVKAHLHIFSVQGDLNDSLYLKKELYEKINHLRNV